MFDSHLHTKFSTDSRMTIDEAIASATAQDLGLIITEHMDIDYPGEGKFIFKPSEYFNEYSKYRNEKLLLGIEMGMQECCIDRNRELANGYPFDYVIGSIHLVNGIDIFQESFYDKGMKQAYTEYFENMLYCVRNSEFIDSLGHIDYISRYATYDDTEIYYKDFPEIIDEILKTIISRNIALEINTRRLHNKVCCESLRAIFQRYHELGGKIATIGSDSHSSEGIGGCFKEALEVLEYCNIKPVYYKERKINYMK